MKKVAIILVDSCEENSFMQKLLQLLKQEDKNNISIYCTKDLFQSLSIENSKSVSKEQIISESLINLGINANTRGYMYLKIAILKAINNPSIIKHITTTLYPEIAKMYNIKSNCIERSIRYAITKSFNNLDLDLVKKWFGDSFTNKKKQPTNSQYIANIAERISLL